MLRKPKEKRGRNAEKGCGHMEEAYTVLLLEIRIGKERRKVKHIDILLTKYKQIFSFNSERSQTSSDTMSPMKGVHGSPQPTILVTEIWRLIDSIVR